MTRRDAFRFLPEHQAGPAGGQRCSGHMPAGLIGITLYVASRTFSPEEERTLSEAFGAAWDEYCNNVKMPWL
jgi:protein-S-isoprenylcysteine O-methyltransferase Ste14